MEEKGGFFPTGHWFPRGTVFRVVRTWSSVSGGPQGPLPHLAKREADVKRQKTEPGQVEYLLRKAASQRLWPSCFWKHTANELAGEKAEGLFPASKEKAPAGFWLNKQSRRLLSERVLSAEPLGDSQLVCAALGSQEQDLKAKSSKSCSSLPRRASF